LSRKVQFKAEPREIPDGILVVDIACGSIFALFDVQEREREYCVMGPRPLAQRVIEAAEAALQTADFVTPIDVLVAIGWLDGGAVARWRQGRIPSIESAVQAPPSRIFEALDLLGSWAAQNGLIPNEVQYLERSTERRPLRFSQSTHPALERLYRTHWVSSALPERERKHLVEKFNQPPELVVIWPLKDDWTCNRCGGGGDFLTMEPSGPACLGCVGLEDLEFLAAGDALLTRRAKAKGTRHAVVVRFSRNRRRYERRGLLVEPAALAEAEREIKDRKPAQGALTGARQ